MRLADPGCVWVKWVNESYLAKRLADGYDRKGVTIERIA